MAAVQFQVPYQCVVVNGLPVAYAKLFFYTTGTLTPLPSYTTSGLTTPHPSPVPANSSGRLPDIYLDNTKTYRLIIKDRNGATIDDIDPFIPGTIPLASALQPYANAAAASAAAAGTSAAAASAASAEASGSADDAAASAALALSAAAIIAVPNGNGELMPEMFGVNVGTGSNDTTAFQSLAAAIMAVGGGTIVLRPGATYLVGRQSLVNDGTFMWKGEAILTLDGCTRPISIVGNGAKLKLAPSLKFGTFNAAGAATSQTLPYSGSQRSDPVREAIVSIKNCTARVQVENLEIDGNDAAQNIGGQYGDTGWQLPGDGLFLYNNSAGEDVRNVYCHHNLRDGVQILGGNSPVSASGACVGSVINIRSEYNGRQGGSFIGGRGYQFRGCRFNKTGKGALYSSPGAGFDIESESGIIRDLHFIDCEFVDNTGVGVIADSGDAADLTFDNCVAIGTTTHATWVRKPRSTWNNCRLVGGQIVPVAAHISNEAEWPVYNDCFFTDDTTYSPTAAVGGKVISNGGTAHNAKFNRCRFRVGYGASAFESNGGYFTDCTFDFGSVLSTFTAPNLLGRTIIAYVPGSAPNIMGGGGGVQDGSISYNGVQQRSGTATYNPPSLTNGARTTTTVSVPWARLGRDVPIVTFGLSLQGISTAASYVSADGTVTVVMDNNTGGTIDLASATLTVAVKDRAIIG